MLKQVTMAATGLVLGLSMTAQAGTLEDVQKRGSVSCGVSTGLAGFSQKDEKGKWSGIDVDVCRAVAAAVLGDSDKVQYKPLTAKERFTALQSGEVDMLSRNTTWTLTRDVSLGLNFAGVNYYDGQGFMVSKSLGVSSVNDLDGAAVCIQAGTTTELNLADYFRAHGMKYTAITFDTSDQTRSGFESGRCDVLTSDQSQLYALRIGLKKPSSAMVLPEVISKEPLGPVVRQGDDAWFNVVKWSLAALIEAEFLNVTSSTASKLAKSGTPEQQRLLGNTGDAGSKLGLDAKWAYNIVSQVGNYSEVFERNVGSGSPLKIARGLNAQWNKGGIMYSNPIR
ncbi:MULTISPECIES: amino acid ABC transporter substrate-binding protein [unclassified Oceanobacter]|jgi:general L-amino acid transport system substrate-binding protein|uniref:amino acid ABC transporter substrate-binding protein n=1 Tax=unclassified Oceanobacter TaxID=2620260 RepID=UPI0027360FD0|nr:MULTISPECIES: amino acid ABC transporter substrate-binding protein [unclassified Oceanobacter]MDP2505189.1 amino acid ABC transporter substrate-binding protein [Oceanobacter sp. 3_MG-2023]MDP2610346.1 amino acid ABC transporter substrate-binding protein [Oceanobacter sp. 1_MG-2023]MDP2613723.1 amino acid ABC transporter substrate-binding protein [Oceanobacter sp. 2_MG-2023]